LSAPLVFFFLQPFTALLTLAAIFFGLASGSKSLDRRAFAWFMIGILLLSTNAASYTFILLLLPVVLLLEHAELKERIFLIVSYIALNFFVSPGSQRFFPKLWILAALFLIEGREYWRSFSPKLVAGGLAAAMILAAFVAKRHEARYLLEPGRHFQRVAQDQGTFLSTFPAVSSVGLFYQAMVPSGYVIRWLHDGKMEELALEGEAFHPVAPSFQGLIYFELVKNRSSTTMTFDPATRSVARAALPLPATVEGTAISTDGKWLAFESTQAGPRQVWLKDAVSGKTEIVAGGDCNSSSPAWEKGSDTLIFASDCGRGLGMPVLYRATLPLNTHPN
jgi:hypothetical protein